MRPGDQVGDAVLLRELGRGGMGTVFEARSARHGAVAVKLLAGLPDETARARFVREALAMSGVRHPNVLRVLDAGSAGATPFLVLELAPGGSLAERVKRGGALPWREAARLAAQVARGLDAVHGARLVHRDLKPANVLLAADGTPKLADFGLVKPLDAATRLTETSALPGTPSYMAPEVVAGEEASEAADLYALGCVLHELVTGAPPFAGSGLAVLAKHAREEPRALRERAPGVPAALEALAQRLLAKEPARRESASRAASELEAIAEKRTTARSPVVVALTALVVASSVALVVALRAPKSAPPSPAVVPATQAPTPPPLSPPSPPDVVPDGAAPVASFRARGGISALAWSAGRGELAVGDVAGGLALFQGRSPRTLLPVEGAVTALAFAADRRQLAIGTTAGYFQEELQTGIRLHPWEGWVVGVGFERGEPTWATRDGRIVATIERKETAALQSTGLVREVVFLGGCVFATFDDGRAGVYGLDGRPLEAETHRRESVAFGRHVLHLVGDGGGLNLRHLDGKPNFGHAHFVRRLVTLDDASSGPIALTRGFCAAASEGKDSVRVWSWKPGNDEGVSRTKLALPPGELATAALLHDQTLVVGTSLGQLYELPVGK